MSGNTFRLITRVVLVLPALLAAQLPGQVRIAVADSDNSRIFFAAHYPGCSAGTNTLGAHEFDRYLEGWTHVLDDAGLLYTHLYDSQISETGLAPFKLLILPNAVSLSDDETRAIHNWVIKGGHLIATFGSGYKDIINDPRQIDGLALHEGGTTALHNLWGDPMSKVFSTQAVFPAAPGVDILITQPGIAPANELTGLNGNLLPYGSLANVLIQRPLTSKDVFGILNINPGISHNPQPAILVSKASKGIAVYFAFAPEFLVALEHGLPTTCPDFPNTPWAGRSQAGASLMKSTVQFLLQ